MMQIDFMHLSLGEVDLKFINRVSYGDLVICTFRELSLILV